MLSTIRHSVTRYRITLSCHLATCPAPGRDTEHVHWITPAQATRYPLSVTGRKIWELLEEEMTRREPTDYEYEYPASLSELRRHIAMAFEDATLFSSSVRHNVLLGRDELDIHGPEAERLLHEALAVAQADFVDTLPEGVETVIGEEGLSLSGGQRQRLALARAVAAAPSVLVLDDPLSALDVDTEAAVEEGLRRVLADTTALIVAHRPSTVALADRVALLERGRVTAVGTHSELMASSPHYRHVISSLEDEEAREREQEVNL